MSPYVENQLSYAATECSHSIDLEEILESKVLNLICGETTKINLEIFSSGIWLRSLVS